MIARLRGTSSAFVFVLLAACFASCAIGQSQNIQDLSTFPRTTLEIHTKPQSQKFNVWIADTPARQSQGLMFVRDLPADEGMIFPNAKPRVASMWMKNTYIELDMLFVAPDGRIAKIAEHTVPHSLATISSDAPIAAVIELKGGESARRGLKVGDLVSWPHDK
jgi:uncharacterized membrane protein (UPF0127 family)